MTKNETILCKHISKLNTRIGNLEGFLMAMRWYNLPKDIDEKITNVLNKKTEVFPELEKKIDDDEDGCQYFSGGGEYCDHMTDCGTYQCTRRKGHGGDHVACGEKHEMKFW